MNLLTVATIFKQLEETSGRKEKERILLENMDNRDFIDAIYYIYNPHSRSGISNKKLSKDIVMVVDTELHTIQELISYLKKNNTGRDLDVAIMQKVINSLSTTVEKDFAFKMITQTLKVGVTSSTINKVYKERLGVEIPEESCMLAVSYSKLKNTDLPHFHITKKLDGHRCTVEKVDGVVTFIARSSLPIEGLVEFTSSFDNLPDNTVFDGELLASNEEGLSAKDLYRKTSSIIRSKGDKVGLVFHMFDIIPFDEFKDGKSTLTYTERRAILDTLPTNHLVQVVPVLYAGEDTSQISHFTELALQKEEEGIMVNISDASYETKRTKNILKVKDLHSCDGIVREIYEGKEGTKNEGKLGGIVVTFEDITVRVGSGFTDEERVQFWNNPELIVGKVVEYLYTEESKNKQGGRDLRFARFKQIRLDKTEKDVNYE